MTIREITPADVANRLRLDEYNLNDLTLIMSAAKSFIVNYTGLADEELDNYDDLSIAYLALCQDMYDNRAYSADDKAAGVNRVVDSILGMHRRNLL